MRKEGALKLLMVLSSLESWAMAHKIGVPEHERKHLTDAVELLTKIILKTDEKETSELEKRAWVGSGDLEDSSAYHTPPQRTWVGLTDEEVDYAAHYCVKSGQAVNAAIRAIEAKLKEKNK
jgi:hypothetical protein